MGTVFLNFKCGNTPCRHNYISKDYDGLTGYCTARPQDVGMVPCINRTDLDHLICNLFEERTND